jgi:hypothetical protein
VPRTMRTSGSLHSPFPDLFTFSIGALTEGDWWELTYLMNVLRFRTGTTASYDLHSRQVLCTPDPATWARFWRAIDRIGVWEWKPDYTDPGVIDGEGWHLEIQHAGRSLKPVWIASVTPPTQPLGNFSPRSRN